MYHFFLGLSSIYLLDLNAIDLDERKFEKKTDNETNHAHHKTQCLWEKDTVLSHKQRITKHYTNHTIYWQFRVPVFDI